MKSKSVKCFDWLLKSLMVEKEKCYKVLIYCKSQSLVAWLFGQFQTILDDKIYFGNISDPKNLLVNMFHTDTPEFVKKRCLHSLTNDNQLSRVIFAIGCGINVNNLKYVCHFGPAYSLVDYCQQIGRAGRNDEPDCHAVLYVYPTSTRGTNLKMKEYAELEVRCLRSSLFSPFNDAKTVQPLSVGHTCCSVCTSTCNCGMEHEFVFENENVVYQEEPKLSIRDVTPKDKEAIKALLISYHHECCSQDLSLPSSSISGLTKLIVARILEELQFIDSPNYLMDNLSILDMNVAENVYQII